MKKEYKIAIWMVLVALFAIGLWINIDIWFNHSGALSYSNWNLLSFLFLILLISSLGVGLMIFRNMYIDLGMIVIAVLPQLVLFGFSYINITGLVILILMLLRARSKVASEMKERIKIRTGDILAHSIKPLIIGILILVSFSAYQSEALTSIQKMDRVPSVSVSFAKEMLNRMVGTEYGLTEEMKNDVVQQATDDVNDRINSLVSPYLEYAPPFLAFLLFLILAGLSWIFMGLSTALAEGFVAILRMIKFLRVEEYDIKAEKLVI